MEFTKEQRNNENYTIATVADRIHQLLAWNNSGYSQLHITVNRSQLHTDRPLYTFTHVIVLLMLVRDYADITLEKDTAGNDQQFLQTILTQYLLIIATQKRHSALLYNKLYT